MPEGDGLFLLQQIREKWVPIPVILMTGYADLSEKDAKEKGAFRLISKPFDLEELSSWIHDAVAPK